MKSWNEIWTGTSSDTNDKVLAHSLLPEAPFHGPQVWAALESSTTGAVDRGPLKLKAVDFWGDVALDLPLSQLCGKRTPADVCRCDNLEQCELCQLRARKLVNVGGSRASTPLPGSRAQTPGTRPPSRQTRASTPGPGPEKGKNCELPAMTTPRTIYGNCAWTGIAKQKPSQPVEHSQKWFGATEISRKSCTAQMPAWTILRRDMDEDPTARDAEVALVKHRKHEIAKLQHRIKMANEKLEEERAKESMYKKMQNAAQEKVIKKVEDESPLTVSLKVETTTELNLNSKRKKQERKIARLNRLDNLSRNGSKRPQEEQEKEEEIPEMGLGPSELDLRREQERQLLLAEGERLTALLEARDVTTADETFDRYDEDISGTLEIGEIRAVLADLGLLPTTTEEKAGVRQTLINFARGVRDGNTDSERESSGDEGFPMSHRKSVRRSVRASMYQAPKNKATQEDVARSVTVTKEKMPELLTRIRNRLKASRRQIHFEAFQRYDVLDHGEFDIGTVARMLQELGFLPQSAEDIHEFGKWILDVVKPDRTDDIWVAAGRHKKEQKRTAVKFNPLQEEHQFGVDGSDEEEVPGAGEQAAGGTDNQTEETNEEEVKEEQKIKAVRKDRIDLQYIAKHLKDHLFDKFELEVLIDYQQEAREKRRAQEQIQAANQARLTSAKLFGEFRQELIKLRDLFMSFDDDMTGFLNKNEVWIALSTLGLVPQGIKDKVTVMLQIATYSIKGAVERSTEYGELSTALQNLLEISGESELFSATICDPDYRMDFEGFLELLSKVRAWQTSNMREELRPLFDRMVRRRKSIGTEKVIGVAEVAVALEELAMAPKDNDQQVELFRFLNEANEWGFQPVTLDFEAFIRFIRRVKEWRSLENNVEDQEYAVTELRFTENLVRAYRVVFDIIDIDGNGSLNVTGVRKAVQILNHNVHNGLSSEELRELFKRVDKDGTGSISFLEFMHLVYELAPPAPPVLRSPTRSDSRPLQF